MQKNHAFNIIPIRMGFFCHVKPILLFFSQLHSSKPILNGSCWETNLVSHKASHIWLKILNLDEQIAWQYKVISRNFFKFPAFHKADGKTPTRKRNINFYLWIKWNPLIALTYFEYSKAVTAKRFHKQVVRYSRVTACFSWYLIHFASVTLLHFIQFA